MLIRIIALGGLFVTLLPAQPRSRRQRAAAEPRLHAQGKHPSAGTWRFRFSTADVKPLRIYRTTIRATNRIFNLMHLNQYRMAVPWEDAGYNRPLTPSFYMI